MILAKEYNKTKSIDGKIMIEVLLNKPLGVFKEKKRTKKNKKNVSIDEKEETKINVFLF